MSGLNYSWYGGSSSRTTLGVSPHRCNTRRKVSLSYYSREDDRWQFEEANWKLNFVYFPTDLNFSIYKQLV